MSDDATSADNLNPAPDTGARLPWWALPAAVLLVVTVLGLFVGAPPQEAKPRTVYDATHEGTRAAYLLLDELDYPVAISRQPATGRVRWVQLDIDEAAEDLDHLITPEERLRIAMARQ